MALFSTHSIANQVVVTALATTITSQKKQREVKQGNSTYQVTYIEYVRNRTMQYKYVGMSETAAKTCADDMRSKYTRNARVWSWIGGTTGYWQLEPLTQKNMQSTASINCTHIDGHMWEVTIDLSESLPFYAGESYYLDDPATYANTTVFVDVGSGGVSVPWTYELT